MDHVAGLRKLKTISLMEPAPPTMSVWGLGKRQIDQRLVGATKEAAQRAQTKADIADAIHVHQGR
jgi:hypothetical protein